MNRDLFDFSRERALHPLLLEREELLAELERQLAERPPCLLLRGAYGRGKAALLCHLLERLAQRRVAIPHHFIRRNQLGWADPENIARSLIGQLERDPRFAEQLRQSPCPPGALIELLSRLSAEQLARSGEHLIMMVYGLDEVEHRAGEHPLARFLPQLPIPGITWVLASRPTPELARLEAHQPRLFDLDGARWRASNQRACRELWRRTAAELALPRPFAAEAARRAEGNLLYCTGVAAALKNTSAKRRRAVPLPIGLRGWLASRWKWATRGAANASNYGERGGTTAHVAHAALARRTLGLLCVARAPLPISLLRKLSDAKDAAPETLHELGLRIVGMIAEVRAADDDEGALQIAHEALREVIASQLAPHELAAHHALLARELAAWPPAEPRWRDYALAHGLRHRIEAGLWEEAAAYGQDLDRLLAQCRELGPHVIEADFAFAAERCPEGEARRRWLDLLRAVRAESTWLAQAPAQLPELLYNKLRTLGWSVAELAAMPGMTPVGDAPARSPAWRLRHPLQAPRHGLLRTILRRGPMIAAAAFTRDGRLLTDGVDGLIELWDVETGRALGSLSGHTGQIYHLAVTADGKYAVSASTDGLLIVWNLATGRPHATLRGHDKPVLWCAVLPDQQHVMSSSSDRTARIWRLDGRGTPLVLRGHRGQVHHCAASADGAHLLSADEGPEGRHAGTVHVWTRRGELVKKLTRREPGARCAFTPDGAGVLSHRGLEIRRWDLTSRRDASATSRPFHETGVLIGCAALPSGMPMMMSYVRNCAWLRDLDTGELFARLEDGAVNAYCTLSPDGKLAATASSDGLWSMVNLWDLEAARRTSELRLPIASCAVSRDGNRAVSSNDAELRAWDTVTGGASPPHADAGGGARLLDLTPDGRLALWSDAADTARLWDIEKQRDVLELRPTRHSIVQGALGADGRRIALATEKGRVELRQARARARTDEPADPPLRTTRGDIAACRLDARGARLYLGADALTLHDLKRKRRRTIRRLPREHMTALAVSPDGSQLAFCCYSSPEIQRWHEARGPGRPLVGHALPIAGCAFLGERQLVSASEDRTLKIWDLATGECLHTVYGPARFTSLAAADKLIVAGDELGNLWMLEPRPAAPPRMLPVGEVKARHALLFGVDSYQSDELDDLPEAANDVKRLAEVLDAAGYQTRAIHGDTERPPTLARVRAALRALTLAPDDLLLVHFSCHGERLGGKPYLFMEDTPNPPSQQHALAVAEVLELMAASGARRRVLLIDACNAGSELGDDGKPVARTPDEPDAPSPPPEEHPTPEAPRRPAPPRAVDRYVHQLGEGTVTICGSTSVQETQQDGAYGAFTATVIAALERARRQRRALSVTALANQVTAAVRGSGRQGIAQDPTVQSDLLGDFLVVDGLALA